MNHALKQPSHGTPSLNGDDTPAGADSAMGPSAASAGVQALSQDLSQLPPNARLRSGAAARLAGLPVTTLRVWERRYGVVSAPKTATGQRQYGAVDVQRLALLKLLSNHGHAIGTMADLPLADLRSLFATVVPALLADPSAPTTQAAKAAQPIQTEAAPSPSPQRQPATLPFTAQVSWQRGAAEVFTDSRYSRRHHLRFDGGAVVLASSSPQVVPLPASDAAGVDPEEMFVASLSSCHMLWFLSLAAADGWLVNHYVDDAQGVMGRNAQGRMAMTQVTLRPRVEFTQAPGKAALLALHERAHHACYVANSVLTEVRCEPDFQPG